MREVGIPWNCALHGDAVAWRQVPAIEWCDHEAKTQARLCFAAPCGGCGRATTPTQREGRGVAAAAAAAAAFWWNLVARCLPTVGVAFSVGTSSCGATAATIAF